VSKKQSQRAPHVLVIGDVMLDHYVHGSVKRISPEAPVPVLEFESEKFVPGGAANVAANLAALGVTVELFGVVGDDDLGGELLNLLVGQKIGCQCVKSDKRRCTTVKQRIVSGQQIVRVDRESHRHIDKAQENALMERILFRMTRADAIIISDYAKGVVTQSLVDRVIAQAKIKKVPVVMNLKPANTVTPHGAFAIQVNRKEAFELAVTFDDGSWPRLREAAASLMIRYEPKNVIITLGANGAYLYQAGTEPIHVPTDAKEVVDVSGAGDTVIAAFTYSILQSSTVENALRFANKAAGIVVGKHGTAAVSLHEL
jgi:rfaE bifunctional protein kinase chain/domain